MTALPEMNVRRLTPVASPAAPARAKRRHFLASGSFLLCVVCPIATAAFYLFSIAVDQFASTVGFSVRNEDMASPVELFGGFADITSTGSSDAAILNEYLRSQEMVERLDARLSLAKIYERDDDPVFAFDPSGTIEDLHRFWDRMLRVQYDTTTELIEIRVLAFTPEDAQRVATAVFEESARLVDDLSTIAQKDTIAFAAAEMERVKERVTQARTRLTRFRSRTQIVDPAVDLQGQMGLLGTLEEQLAKALIDDELLRDSTRPSDPRLDTSKRRIAAIEARIAEERRNLGGGEGEDYAELLSEYERLAVDVEFAEQSFTAARAAYDQALAEARRKSRYLAAHIQPTLAQSAQFPRKFVLLGLVSAFCLMLWGIGMLIFYSVRDRQ